MKRSALRPGKKCQSCRGKGCAACSHRGFIINPPKAKPRIKPVKDGRSNLNHQYSALRRGFLLAHPRCEVLQPHGGICGAIATELHHRKGRGRFYLRQDTFLATCQTCHEALHHKLAEWGFRMGYRILVASIRPIEPPSQVFLPYTDDSRHQA